MVLIFSTHPPDFALALLIAMESPKKCGRIKPMPPYAVKRVEKMSRRRDARR